MKRASWVHMENRNFRSWRFILSMVDSGTLLKTLVPSIQYLNKVKHRDTNYVSKDGNDCIIFKNNKP